MNWLWIAAMIGVFFPRIGFFLLAFYVAMGLV